MELYIDRDELLRGLSRVQGIVDRRNTPNPILSHVLLQATVGEGGAGRLRLTATDTEVAFIGDFVANVIEGGELAVHASNFFQITRVLPDNTVHLKRGPQNRLEVTSGPSWYKVLGLPGEDYPPLPEFDGRATMTINATTMRRLIERTSFAICPDDNRYGINGAHLQDVGEDGVKRLRMVATDGHRLAYAEAPYEGELGIGPRLLLPRKAVSEIKKLTDGNDGDLTLTFGENAALIQDTTARFYFRLIDGEFPDYGPVIPSRPKRLVYIVRESFAAALKRVGLLAADKTRPVRFGFMPDNVVISAQNSDIGEAREEVPIEMDGTALEVGFNVRYFNDVLSVVGGERVLVELGDALSPAVLKEPDTGDSLFVIMPMRLD
jgi:DNA polymerase-3 subunit beta